ncbi:Formamidopyrimidine-DNA glycosylase [Ophiocordyceps camponoti-floridani]|uniref:Formamidopyrimidine-DNA glycosylase n=1 Tax=Ophiocordyceps camponoti-floridani TaxID=2030778 RepID=A0A8H4VH60_9HYPO|nr:Formamidopyrimidine-DNA glycosylase [Ophiocordyceps camponoti-floridani]
MPEIAEGNCLEVARIVHFLRKKLVGKRIASASAVDDANVFGKVGTSGSAVEKALNGNKVVSAGSQGKYFWITLENSPHVLMHFGMTGWVHIRGEMTAYTNYYKKMKDKEMNSWPPKFTKFHLTTVEEPVVEVAFTDPRRFGRVRLMDCPGAEIRKHSPLVENGPDPVVDVDVFTEAYLRCKMRSRHVPIKALLLDQTTISGIGNWVADETLYHAKIHPEQHCDYLDDAQVATLYRCIRYVCQTAVDELGDSDRFPDHWLFNHRWGKSRGLAKLPNGERLAFVTVGGRTSCYAPALQKLTAGGRRAVSHDEPAEAPRPKKRRTKTNMETDDEQTPKAATPPRRSARLRKS